MYQIGIVSRNTKRLIQIQSELDKSFTLSPKAHLWADRVIHDLKSKKIQGLIIGLEAVGAAQINLIKRLYETFDALPVVVIGELIGPTARKLIEGFGSNVAVKHVDDIDQVAGIMEKLLRGESVKTRNHQRYSASTAISLQSQSGDRIVLGSGRMSNLGYGGVQVRVFGKNYMKGDTCTVEVPGGYIGHSRRLQAKVVWTKNELSSPDKPMRSQVVGLEFSN